MADNSFKVKNSIVIQGIELDLSAATPNYVLAFDGTKFAPTELASGAPEVSDTAPSSPTAGALWFNSSQGRLFSYYDSSWVEISGAVGATGPTGPDRLSVSDDAPSSPSSGDLWFDSSNASLFSYYDSAWVEITGRRGAEGPTGPTGPAQLANVSASQPSDPQTGQLWYNTSNGTLNVYDGSAWNSV